MNHILTTNRHKSKKSINDYMQDSLLKSIKDARSEVWDRYLTLSMMGAPYFANEYKEFDSLSSSGLSQKFKISKKRFKSNRKNLRIGVNLNDPVSIEYFHFLAAEIILDLKQSTMHTETEMYVYYPEFKYELPKVKCSTYVIGKDFHYSELVQELNPKTILCCYPNHMDLYLKGFCVLAVYCFDKKGNSIITQMIEFHQSYSKPNKCKPLRCPKNVSEFNEVLTSKFLV